MIKTPVYKSHCHKAMAKLAQEMAAVAYETLAKNNEFHSRFPSQKGFVDICWPQFLEDARATLVELLTTNMAEALKEEIMSVLMLDNQLREGRLAKPRKGLRH